MVSSIMLKPCGCHAPPEGYPYMGEQLQWHTEFSQMNKGKSAPHFSTFTLHNTHITYGLPPKSAAHLLSKSKIDSTLHSYTEATLSWLYHYMPVFRIGAYTFLPANYHEHAIAHHRILPGSQEVGDVCVVLI